MSRLCCHPGCEVRVDPPHVLCVPHWRALPARVQSECQYRLRAYRGTRCEREAAAREFVGTWFRASLRKAAGL